MAFICRIEKEERKILTFFRGRRFDISFAYQKDFWMRYYKSKLNRHFINISCFYLHGSPGRWISYHLELGFCDLFTFQFTQTASSWRRNSPSVSLATSSIGRKRFALESWSWLIDDYQFIRMDENSHLSTHCVGLRSGKTINQSWCPW